MLTHNKHIFVMPKRCAYFGNFAYLEKKCLFWEMNLFGEKVLILKNELICRKSAYFRKCRISHLKSGLYRIGSSIRMELFAYNFYYE